MMFDATWFVSLFLLGVIFSWIRVSKGVLISLIVSILIVVVMSVGMALQEGDKTLLHLSANMIILFATGVALCVPILIATSFTKNKVWLGIAIGIGAQISFYTVYVAGLLAICSLGIDCL